MCDRVRLAFALALSLGLATPGHAADLEALQTLRQGVGGVDGLEGAEEVVVSGDGLFAYVAAEDDEIGIFDVDETLGTIAFNSVFAIANASPRALALSPDADNQNLYVTSQSLNQILWFDRDPQTGLLSAPLMNSITATGSNGLMGAWSVAVSADGLHVYVTGLGDNSLAAFDRDPVSGALTFAEVFTDTLNEGMTSPLEVRISPDDTQVFVASQGDADVVGLAFDRDALDPISASFAAVPVSVAGRGSSKSVAISPDGTSVYFGVQTAVSGNPGIAVYDRDPMTNMLTPSDLVDDPALLTVAALSVSPDGRSVIAAADVNNSLITYSRSGAGTLSFFEQLDDLDLIPGGGGFVGLEVPTSIAITESGSHAVAVAKGSGDQAINLFAPEPAGVGLAAAALAVLGALSGRRRRGAGQA